MTEQTMLDALRMGGYGNCRAQLLDWLLRLQREFCGLCALSCPMTQHNVFDELRVAIEAMDSDAVEQVITVQIPKMIEAGGRIQEIGVAMLNVLTGLPRTWGGKTLEEKAAEMARDAQGEVKE